MAQSDSADSTGGDSAAGESVRGKLESAQQNYEAAKKRFDALSATIADVSHPASEEKPKARARSRVKSAGKLDQGFPSKRRDVTTELTKKFLASFERILGEPVLESVKKYNNRVLLDQHYDRIHARIRSHYDPEKPRIGHSFSWLWPFGRKLAAAKDSASDISREKWRAEKLKEETNPKIEELTEGICAQDALQRWYFSTKQPRRAVSQRTKAGTEDNAKFAHDVADWLAKARGYGGKVESVRKSADKVLKAATVLRSIESRVASDSGVGKTQGGVPDDNGLEKDEVLRDRTNKLIEKFIGSAVRKALEGVRDHLIDHYLLQLDALPIRSFADFQYYRKRYRFVIANDVVPGLRVGEIGRLIVAEQLTAVILPYGTLAYIDPSDPPDFRNDPKHLTSSREAAR